MIESFMRKLGAKWGTVLLLLPMSFFGILNFGWKAGAVLLISVLSACIAGGICAYFEGKEIKVNPGSIITGLLIGLTVSHQTPIYMIVAGTFTAELFVKGIFGRNWFNPAVVGRTVIAILETFDPIEYSDLSTGASALFKDTGGASEPDFWMTFLGFTKGSIGETSALLLIICGFLMFRYVVIKRYAAVAMLMTIPVVALIVPDSAAMIGHSPWTSNPALYLIGGPSLLMAFFFLTDPATIPNNKIGCIIFGVFVGAFAVIGKMHTTIPGVEMYGILIMNAFTPLINKVLTKKQ